MSTSSRDILPFSADAVPGARPRRLTVALCILCNDRRAELAAALSSVDGDAWDEIIVLDMASDPALTAPSTVRLLRSETNIGAPAGRNRLATASVSDILVFLDDDAVLRTTAADSVRTNFESDPSLAIVAFQVRRPGGRILGMEFPFRGPVRDPEMARPCAYFLAGGYACRRAAVEDVGGYDERMAIYSEELDLSYRLLSRAWRLRYEPFVVVEHNPSPRRTSSAALAALTIRNRWLTMRAFLPRPLIVLHMSIWSLITLVMAARARDLAGWRRAWVEGVRTPVDRHPLSWRLLREIHRKGGRVIW